MAKLQGAVDAGLKPSWSVVLKYEFEVRKLAMKLVKDKGLTLSQALDAACEDSETRQLYLMTYLLVEKRTNKRDYDDFSGGGGAGAGKGKNKDKGKGKGKGKNKGGGGKHNDKPKEDFNAIAKKCGFELMARTPDRRPICFRFNEHRGCAWRCNMLHVCRIKGCYDKTHCMTEHPGWPKSE